MSGCSSGLRGSRCAGRGGRWLVVLVLAAAGACGGSGSRPTPGPRRWWTRSRAEFQATERFRESFGDEAAVVLVREDLRQLTLTQDLQALFELETCLAGGTELAETLPAPQGRAAARGLRPDRRAGAEPGRATGRRPSSTSPSPRSSRCCRARSAPPSRRPSGRRGRPAAQAAAAGASGSRAAAGRRAGEPAGAGGLPERAGAAGAEVRDHPPAAPGRPAVHQPRRLRPARAGRHAEGALRLSLPQHGLGPDLGAAAPRPQRRGARARRSTCSSGRPATSASRSAAAGTTSSAGCPRWWTGSPTRCAPSCWCCWPSRSR